MKAPLPVLLVRRPCLKLLVIPPLAIHKDEMIHIPSILYDESQVVTSGKLDPCLYVFDSMSVYSNERDATLAARYSERGIVVMCLDLPVGMSVHFEGVELHGPSVA